MLIQLRIVTDGLQNNSVVKMLTSQGTPATVIAIAIAFVFSDPHYLGSRTNN